MAYDNAALARRLIDEVWCKGNLSAADEFLSPTAVLHDPLAGELSGIEAFKARVREFRGAFPDLRVDLDELIVVGDRVITRWTASGTQKGPIMGIPPTGRKSAVSGMSITRIVSGKFVEEWTSWDTLKFMQNLGLVMQLAESDRKTEEREVRPH
jgi:steroid delta-isomerase-like uncharacterized protein